MIIDERNVAERFAQLVRAGMPFNPVSKEEITGANAERLMLGMRALGWSDARFLTKDEALNNGWTVPASAKSIEVLMRNEVNGAVEKVAMFNAGSIVGMPSIASMLDLSGSQLDELQERAVGLMDEVGVKPARRLEIEAVESAIAQSALRPSMETQSAEVGGGASGAIVGEEKISRFAVLAPYWQDGLHNHAGVALQREINKVMHASRLWEDRHAIERLMEVRPEAKALGLKIVPEWQYFENRDFWSNLAEPATLQSGAFVRDKEGMYRPAGGGSAVLVDKGDALAVKGKEGYQAAIELAIAKGWTAIELTGKPAMLADVWLEAKMLGIEVVNYAPTEKDRTAYEARVAEESRLKAVPQEASLAPEEESVEMRPFMDTHGEKKIATVSYTINDMNGARTPRFDDAKSAAKAFAAVPAASLPAVIRIITRVDGAVREDIVAGTEIDSYGKGLKSVDEALDKELAAMFSQVIESEKAIDALSRGIASGGMHAGPIVAVEKNRIAQKVGREADNLVWHDISKLQGRVPMMGEMAEIHYANSVGTVIEKQPAHELDGGRALSR